MFFVSDNHFYHKNIKKFCPNTRAGDSIEGMNELMIEAHNSIVGMNDEVWFLGDFSFGNLVQTAEIINRLNGKKHLILGNHDNIMKNNVVLKDKFETVQYYKKLTINKISVILFHYPMREWESMHYGSVHLFGHVHGKLNSEPHGRSMDVGIDARPDCLMRPWHWDEIWSVMKDREILKHHGEL